MSTAKHTPGSWTALVNSIVTVGIPGRGALAIIRETPCESGLNLSPEIAQANARLIAAAPDLLAAWKDAPMDAGRRNDRIEAMFQAEAAIKQAEGELC